MTFGELVWNVSWNQRLHKVCAYRGLGGAHVAVLAMCASWGLLIAARRSAMRAVVGGRSRPPSGVFEVDSIDKV